MADNLRKAPAKGILKMSSSFDKTEPDRCNNQKEMKWDEMNILQTLHPPDKDYGHMKIDEPKTPYSHFKEPEPGGPKENLEPLSDDETDGLDVDLLAKKIQLGSNKLPKALEVDDDEDDEDEFANETEEERAKRKMFERKRKDHYNEFYAIKLARKLMEEDPDEDEEEEEDNEEKKDNNSVSGENHRNNQNQEVSKDTQPSDSTESKETANLEED